MSFAFAELIVFATPFLELVPPLQCLSGDQWTSCTKEEAWLDGAKYRFVEGDKYTLDNWVDDLDLVCAEEWEIGVIGKQNYIWTFRAAI